MFRYSNEKKKSPKNVLISYLSIGGMNSIEKLGRACADADVDAYIEFEAFESAETLRDPAEYRRMVKSAGASNLFIIDIHGDPSMYKKFDALRKVVTEDSINTFLNCMSEESMSEQRCLFLMDDENTVKLKPICVSADR